MAKSIHKHVFIITLVSIDQMGKLTPRTHTHIHDGIATAAPLLIADNNVCMCVKYVVNYVLCVAD